MAGRPAIKFLVGSGCDSVDKVVASNTRSVRFKSCQVNSFIEHLFSVDCINQTKIKEKGGREWPILKLIELQFVHSEIFSNLFI